MVNLALKKPDLTTAKSVKNTNSPTQFLTLRINNDTTFSLLIHLDF